MSDNENDKFRASNLYLIQGVFFQQKSWIDVAVVPIEGAIAVVRTGLCQFLYSGVLEQDPDDILSGYRGQMIDHLGSAELKEVRFDELTFSFIKQYHGGRPHPNLITYNFERKSVDDLVWVGTYSICDGKVFGESHCILTPISREFFQLTMVPQFVPR